MKQLLSYCGVESPRSPHKMILYIHLRQDTISLWLWTFCNVLLSVAISHITLFYNCKWYSFSPSVLFNTFSLGSNILNAAKRVFVRQTEADWRVSFILETLIVYIIKDQYLVSVYRYNITPRNIAILCCIDFLEIYICIYSIYHYECIITLHGQSRRLSSTLKSKLLHQMKICSKIRGQC